MKIMIGAISDKNRGIMYCVIAAICWSTGGLFVKILPQDAFTILFYRSFFTVVFFLIVLREKVFKINQYSLLTALFYAPMMICFVNATKLTSAANAIFLQSTSVAYVLLLEPFILRTKLLKIDIITVVLCFIGMLLFLINGLDIQASNAGIWIAMLSGLVSAGMILTQKKNTSEFVPSGIVMGNLIVVLFTIGSFKSSPYPSTNEWLIFMFLGFIQLGLGFLLFSIGQRFISAIESSLIGIIEPIMNPIWVMLGYGEIPSFMSLIGGTLIIVSIMAKLFYEKMVMKA
jgi:drug/metabolite transporter, DME family